MAGKTSSDLALLFHQIITLLLHSAELDDALRPTLLAVRDLLPESTVGLYRYWPKTEELEVIAIAPAGEAETLMGTRLSLSGWRPGEVVRTGRPIHLPAVTLKPGAPTVDLLCAPVLGANRDVLGVLQAASTRPNTFSDEDLNILGAVASLFGLAEENVRRGEALQSATISRLYAEYVTAMADMTSHITHRIVNDMGAIRLNVEVIRRQHEKGQLTAAFLAEKLASIEENAENTTALLRRIRRPFDKIDTMPLQLEPMLDEVVQQLIPPDVVLIRQSALDLPLVMATRHLADVFRHLIGNALEAMSAVETKKLTLLTRCTESGDVEVVVEDTGPGVSETLQDSLFLLGITDKRDALGYGLWWSRLYLTRIGGALALDTGTRQGARFVVRLRAAGTAG